MGVTFKMSVKNKRYHGPSRMVLEVGFSRPSFRKESQERFLKCKKVLKKVLEVKKVLEKVLKKVLTNQEPTCEMSQEGS